MEDPPQTTPPPDSGDTATGAGNTSTNGNASSSSDSSPDVLFVVGSYIAVIIGAAAAGYVYGRTDPKLLVVDTTGFTVFAPLYIAAQAIERFLEPLAALVKTTTSEKLALKQARQKKIRLEGLPDGHPDKTPAKLGAADGKVEETEAALAKGQANRALLLWAAASIFGLVICSMLGLGLIESVVKKQPGSEFIRTIDVILTGLAVGAGTKPLHDLISRIEKAKDNADTATKAAVPAS